MISVYLLLDLVRPAWALPVGCKPQRRLAQSLPSLPLGKAEEYAIVMRDVFKGGNLYNHPKRGNSWGCHNRDSHTVLWGNSLA